MYMAKSGKNLSKLKFLDCYKMTSEFLQIHSRNNKNLYADRKRNL